MEKGGDAWVVRVDWLIFNHVILSVSSASPSLVFSPTNTLRHTLLHRHHHRRDNSPPRQLFTATTPPRQLFTATTPPTTPLPPPPPTLTRSVRRGPIEPPPPARSANVVERRDCRVSRRHRSLALPPLVLARCVTTSRRRIPTVPFPSPRLTTSNASRPPPPQQKAPSPSSPPRRSIPRSTCALVIRPQWPTLPGRPVMRRIPRPASAT